MTPGCDEVDELHERFAAAPITDKITDKQLARCFNVGVGSRHATRLLGGAREPLYLPPGSRGPGSQAIIRYTHDYPASVLHEVAHWCIAGRHRRTLMDYGYWYQPPPRDPIARSAFIIAEVRVQVLESIFTAECGLAFAVSLDDPGAADGRQAEFGALVRQRAALVAEVGVPPRAAEFVASLRRVCTGPGRPSAVRPVS